MEVENNTPEGHEIIIFKAKTTLQKDEKMIRAVSIDFKKNKLAGADLAKVFHEVLKVVFNQLHGFEQDDVNLDPNGIYRYIFHSDFLPRSKHFAFQEKNFAPSNAVLFGKRLIKTLDSGMLWPVLHSMAGIELIYTPRK